MKVYVSNGLKGPHVYTTIQKLYNGAKRVFPGGGKICAMDHPIMEFTLENITTAMKHWKYVKVKDESHYITISQIYLDDELPKFVGGRNGF